MYLLTFYIFYLYAILSVLPHAVGCRLMEISSFFSNFEEFTEIVDYLNFRQTPIFLSVSKQFLFHTCFIFLVSPIINGCFLLSSTLNSGLFFHLLFRRKNSTFYRNWAMYPQTLRRAQSRVSRWRSASILARELFDVIILCIFRIYWKEIHAVLLAELDYSAWPECPS